MKIVVLCGGTSTERDISIISGTGVCKALRERGHAAILLDVFFGDGRIDLMNAFPDDYDVDKAALYIRSMNPKLKSATANPQRSFFGLNVLSLCRMADIVFLTLHGSNGEDGRVQAAFDLMRIKYTGTNYTSSALSMDKGMTKLMLAAHNIPVPRGTTVHRGVDSIHIEDFGLHFPVVVKVACGGSSVGVYIVYNEEEYEKALEEAFKLEPSVIIEEYIRGREFSVGVIDGKALPIIEIAPKKGFYDYKNKYTPGATVDTCPADLTPDITRKMQAYAEGCYHALFTDAYMRVDFMMNAAGDIYCLEANSLPGMTPTSLMPQEAVAAGMDYGSFCEKLLEVSLAKYR
jgi:D-alanine-D-alanine ligase